MLQSSNINQLSLLVQEKEKVYTFRQLQSKDAPATQKLMNTTFLSHNPVMKLLSVTLEDIQILQSLTIFDQIIQEGLSYGAFFGDELISACLTCDIKTCLLEKGIQPTVTAQLIIDIIDQLFHEFMKKQIVSQKKVAYLNHLGTYQDYLRQNLAVVCAYLSMKECEKLEYEQVFTDSWHQGTYGTFQKVFQQFQILKEINQLKEQPVHVKSLLAELKPLQGEMEK
ncbi:unnamed protein product [Paramecium sonneborni]|uniref:Uncharacterized protein n=1 Tax=Paramecium sonneborni TaxID=65129 RepID=A0A8S1QGA8_9CILI|nr:unnamed protein product [Paramecium sonneborni]